MGDVGKNFIQFSIPYKDASGAPFTGTPQVLVNVVDDIPEPASALLLLSGLLGCAAIRRLRAHV
jgi:hypothetical protein